MNVIILPISINYWAVLAAAVANMVLGFLWYGPLFGAQWMKLTNIDKSKIDDAKKKGMSKIYALAFLTSIVMSFILEYFILGYAQAGTILEGIVLAFLLWIGFFATTQLGSVLWEGKSAKLYFLNTLYYLASLCIMSIILTLWV